MKKWLRVLLTAMLVVSITACGVTEKTTKEKTTNDAELTTTSQTESTQNGASSNSVPTFDELIAQAKASTYKLESYAMETSYTQNAVTELGEQTQDAGLNVKNTTVGEYIVKPTRTHIVTEFEINGQVATSEEYVIESVGRFTLMDGVWSHSKGNSDSLISVEGEDVSESLEQLALIGKENFKIEIDGDTYVLTADLTGDKVKDLLKSSMGGSALVSSDMDLSELNEMYEVMDEIEIKLKTVLHKEHLYLISSETVVQSKATDGEMKMTGSFVTANKFSKHNEITQIVIPEEAMNSIN